MFGKRTDFLITFTASTKRELLEKSTLYFWKLVASKSTLLFTHGSCPSGSQASTESSSSSLLLWCAQIGGLTPPPLPLSQVGVSRGRSEGWERVHSSSSSSSFFSYVCPVQACVCGTEGTYACPGEEEGDAEHFILGLFFFFWGKA